MASLHADDITGAERGFQALRHLRNALSPARYRRPADVDTASFRYRRIEYCHCGRVSLDVDAAKHRASFSARHSPRYIAASTPLAFFSTQERRLCARAGHDTPPNTMTTDLQSPPGYQHTTGQRHALDAMLCYQAFRTTILATPASLRRRSARARIGHF